MKLIVQYSNGEYEIDVDSSDSVEDLKYLIQSVIDVPPTQQCITIADNDAQLTDSKLISQLGLSANAVIHVTTTSAQPAQRITQQELNDTCTRVYSKQPLVQPSAQYSSNGKQALLCTACSEVCQQHNAAHLQRHRTNQPFQCQCSESAGFCLFTERYNTMLSTDTRDLLQHVVEAQYMDMHHQFKARCDGHIAHFSCYEDAAAQQKALAVMPVQRLNADALASYDAQSLKTLSVQDWVLKHLLHWYKHEFFKWTNSPACERCNGACQPTGSTQPSNQERLYKCGIVELHTCTQCGHVTRFPRYNDPIKLLETRNGRCGEWANCFTLLCRALKFDVRICYDWTDHVWNEVYSSTQKRYVHCDSCENAYDSPLMYSNGWGKKLTYCVSVSGEQIVDTTAAYVDKWDECLARRTQCVESWLQSYIDGANNTLLSRCSAARRSELTEIQQRERAVLQQRKQHGIDTSNLKEAEQIGRQTGSVQWKAARGELGKQATVPAAVENKPSTLPDTVTCTVPDTAIEAVSHQVAQLSVDPRQRIKQWFAQYVQQLTTGCTNKQCTNEYCKNSAACAALDATAAAKQALLLVKQYQGSKLCTTLV